MKSKFYLRIILFPTYTHTQMESDEFVSIKVSPPRSRRQIHDDPMHEYKSNTGDATIAVNSNDSDKMDQSLQLEIAQVQAERIYRRKRLPQRMSSPLQLASSETNVGNSSNISWFLSKLQKDYLEIIKDFNLYDYELSMDSVSLETLEKLFQERFLSVSENPLRMNERLRFFFQSIINDTAFLKHVNDDWWSFMYKRIYSLIVLDAWLMKTKYSRTWKRLNNTANYCSRPPTSIVLLSNIFRELGYQETSIETFNGKSSRDKIFVKNTKLEERDRSLSGWCTMYGPESTTFQTPENKT